MSTILSKYFCSRCFTPIFTKSRSPGGSRRYISITWPSPLPITRRGNDYLRIYSTTSNPPSTARPVKMPSSKEGAEKQKKPAVPRPSSSVVLVSPKNEILLLHRVQTSSSFASAHVFPGGNLSSQDGKCPPPEEHSHHDDSPSYRRAAIRELFEESGILLAKDKASGKMIVVDEATRESGRRLIHQNQITFVDWLKQQNVSAEPDINQLIPFTHWITPIKNAKRYTTQMYLYFMPLPVNIDKKLLDDLPIEGERDEIQIPTSDGGVEVTEAQFLPAATWLQRAQKGEIILFPPQFLLLHLVSGFLDKETRSVVSNEEMEKRRAALVEFVHSGSPPWTDKYISPKMLKITEDGRAVLALDDAGPELKGSGRQGEFDRVVLVRFMKGSAREVKIVWKKDALREGKEDRSHL